MNSQQRPHLATSNAFAEAFDQFAQTRLYQRLVDKFTPRPYYLKYRPLRTIALAASYLFNVFSALTAAVLVYFFTLELFGYHIPAIGVTSAFVALLEITKRRTNGVLFKDVLQFQKFTAGVAALAAFALLLSGLSVTSSYFGGDRTVKEFTPPAELVTVDTITGPIREQLATIDKQIEEARQTKWKGTTTTKSQRAIESLTKQKELLTARLIAVENRTDDTNTGLKAEHDTQTTINARNFAAVTLLSELLFLLCAFYLEYYDYRSLAEFASNDRTNQQTNGQPAGTTSQQPPNGGLTYSVPWNQVYPTSTNGQPTNSLPVSQPAQPIQVGETLATVATGTPGERRPIGFFHSTPAGDPHNALHYDNALSYESPGAEVETVVKEVDTSLKPCANCGEMFKPRTTWQKFCRKACREAYHTARHGQKFEPSEYWKTRRRKKRK